MVNRYTHFIPIHIESDVAFMFNQMAKASKLNKSEFLQCLMNVFNEQDIRTKARVDNGLTSPKTE